MPMAELADAIVSCGRSTLEWAMSYIHEHPTWKAEVVYGKCHLLYTCLLHMCTYNSNNACHIHIYIYICYIPTIGDTDSLFVHVPGRSKDEAIALGTLSPPCVPDLTTPKHLVAYLHPPIYIPLPIYICYIFMYYTY